MNSNTPSSCFLIKHSRMGLFCLPSPNVIREIPPLRFCTSANCCYLSSPNSSRFPRVLSATCFLLGFLPTFPASFSSLLARWVPSLSSLLFFSFLFFSFLSLPLPLSPLPVLLLRLLFSSLRFNRLVRFSHSSIDFCAHFLFNFGNLYQISLIC